MITGTDLQGRRYLTFSEAKPGVVVTLDGDFTCARKGQRKMLRKGRSGIYFRCDCGVHLLDGQEDFDGGKFYVGVYPVRGQ